MPNVYSDEWGAVSDTGTFSKPTVRENTVVDIHVRVPSLAALEKDTGATSVRLERLARRFVGQSR
jgi:hypothetical protein